MLYRVTGYIIIICYPCLKPLSLVKTPHCAEASCPCAMENSSAQPVQGVAGASSGLPIPLSTHEYPGQRCLSHASGTRIAHGAAGPQSGVVIAPWACEHLHPKPKTLPRLARGGAGRISGHVLGVYIRSMGGYFRFSVLMVMFALVEAGRVCATVWLSTWTDTADNPAGAPHPAIWYLAIYAAISGIQARGS